MTIEECLRLRKLTCYECAWKSTISLWKAMKEKVHEKGDIIHSFAQEGNA